MDDGDRRQLEEWWQAIVSDPSRLPPGMEHVQSRLIRAVGRATLPSGVGVFLKCMGFPRPKDKLRYAFRSLPAVHEASVLRYVATTGIRVPDVLFAKGIRRGGLPHACVLVTRALPVASTPLTPDPTLDVVFALRDAGVYHPDLHTDNFLTLDDGSIAVIDMQSARRRRNIQLQDTTRMLAPLVAHCAYRGQDIQPWLDALRDREFDKMSVGRIGRLAHQVNHAAIVDRLGRCLKESTQFGTKIGPLRSRYERRSMAGEGDWVEGGAEMFRYWMGDRALEILKGGTPVLAALERPTKFAPGPHRVRLSGGETALQQHVDRLLEGYDLYREQKSLRV
jgi:hypothetical protein